jgi:beta-N-acetylhexosaminidase
MLAACATPTARVSPSPVTSAGKSPGPSAPSPTEPSAEPSATPASTPTAVAIQTPAATPGPTPRPAPSPTPSARPVAPTLAQLIGQKLVVRMDGLTPSASLLGRVRRGEIGGVILFGSNVSSPTQVRALTARLQAAAAAGGQPPLLIATDQEGGTVKRIPWAAPTLSPPEMAAIGLASTARNQGLATGQALIGLGIDCDLAPVADVPASTDSFMYQEDRTWSFDPAVTSSLANAFAHGLRLAGVIPAMKHFPGIGLATQNTDAFVVTLAASQAELAPGLQPYITAISRGVPMIMLSNATYAAYDPVNGAGWSRSIVKTLLRDQLGFRGVTITDSLSGTAKARGIFVSELVLRAAIAGTDMILVTGSEATTQATYEALLAAAASGAIPRARLVASYNRILALKADL